MAREKKESDLEALKKEYAKLRGKYKNLPSFQQLNEDFEIEKIAEKETEFLLREIRKAIAEKSIAFLRFLESLINPSNAPLFIFAILKNLSAQEKKIVEKIYREFCKEEISTLKLDVCYDEKEEVRFIIDSTKRWQELRPELEKLTIALEKAWEKTAEKKEKSYFG